MPRLRYFGALLGIAALLTAPAGAQNAPRVQHVLVRGTGAVMEVEIQTSGSPVAPDTQAITGPDRIVVDFPGALPAADLRALQVNRGALKRVRAGLFFSNPPITRIVLDLLEPQSYRISTIPNAVVVKLSQVKPAQVGAGGTPVPGNPAAPTARLQNASLPADTKVAIAQVTEAASDTRAAPFASVGREAQPPLTVTYTNGMLSIRVQKATLAQVLFEVQRQTHAEIAIPAGAEQEEVVADLGPAPARDVLASLLNGSPYNFIFVGNELALERVILTRRD
jgi:hypothetical protein